MAPHGRSLEIPRGRGVLKVKRFEAKYKAKLEFPGGGGGGLQNKKPYMGRVLIFSGTTHSAFQTFNTNNTNYGTTSLSIHDTTEYNILSPLRFVTIFFISFCLSSFILAFCCIK